MARQRRPKPIPSNNPSSHNKHGDTGQDHRQPYDRVTGTTSAQINSSTQGVGITSSINSEVSSVMDGIASVFTGGKTPSKHDQQTIPAHDPSDKSHGQKSGPGHRITNAFHAAEDTVTGLYHDVTDPVSHGLDDISSVFDEAEDAVSDVFSSIGDAVSDVSDKANDVMDDIKGLPHLMENTWENIKTKGDRAAHNLAKDAEKTLLVVAILGIVVWKATEKQRPVVRDYIIQGGKALGKRALDAAPLLLA